MNKLHLITILHFWLCSLFIFDMLTVRKHLSRWAFIQSGQSTTAAICISAWHLWFYTTSCNNNSHMASFNMLRIILSVIPQCILNNSSWPAWCVHQCGGFWPNAESLGPAIAVHAWMAVKRAIIHSHYHTMEFNFCCTAEATARSGTQASLICLGLCHHSNFFKSVTTTLWCLMMAI